jgi:hypothetical protein
VFSSAFPSLVIILSNEKQLPLSIKTYPFFHFHQIVLGKPQRNLIAFHRTGQKGSLGSDFIPF